MRLQFLLGDSVNSVISVELKNLTRNRPGQSFNLHRHFNSQFKWVKHNPDAWNVLLRALVPFFPHYNIYSAPQLPVCNGRSKANSLHVEMRSAKAGEQQNALIQRFVIHTDVRCVTQGEAEG